MPKTKRCPVCLEDKELSEFYTRYQGTRPQAQCKSCTTLYNSMREYVDGRLVAPKIVDVRKALLGGAAPSPKPALKSAAHPKRPKRPRHPKIEQANKLRREAYAEMERDPSGYVYAIGEQGCNQYVKIGESSDDPRYRAGELQEGNPRTLVVLGVIECDDRKAKETELHTKYLAQNHNQEWFRLTPELLSEFPVQKGD